MGAKDQGIVPSKNRYLVVPRTLIFITHENAVLLLRGSPSKRIWPGLYNGIGGHIERGETIQESALREIREETGLSDVKDLKLRGIITIDADDPSMGILLFVMTAVSPTREVRSSQEGTPEWFEKNTLPTDKLVEDLPILLPHVLAMPDEAPPFFGHYHYDDQDKLIITLLEAQSDQPVIYHT
jgi:8-oxo-dGTP diphosphatase